MRYFAGLVGGKAFSYLVPLDRSGLISPRVSPGYAVMLPLETNTSRRLYVNLTSYTEVIRVSFTHSLPYLTTEPYWPSVAP